MNALHTLLVITIYGFHESKSNSKSDCIDIIEHSKLVECIVYFK